MLLCIREKQNREDGRINYMWKSYVWIFSYAMEKYYTSESEASWSQNSKTTK